MTRRALQGGSLQPSPCRSLFSMSQPTRESRPNHGPVPGLVLLGCVGFSPASVVAVGRDFLPSRAVLIATRKSQAQLAAVTRQLEVPVEAVILDGDGMEPIASLQLKIARALKMAPHESIVLDLTGGTKIMTAATYEAARQLRADKVKVVYLTPDGTIIDATDGMARDSSARLEISEVLEWQGAAISKREWSGPLSAVPKSVTQRAALGRFLLNAYGEKRARIETASNAITISRKPWLTALPPGFSEMGNGRIKSTIPGYFSHNRWLEELCLHQATIALDNCSITRVAAGLHIFSGEHKGSDEADVVLLRGTQVCVIEAKARLDSKGAGADLMKRMQKTRRFFGVMAKTVFVHPAWGPSPPPALVEITGDKGILVGARLKDINTAIREALSIRTDFATTSASIRDDEAA